MVPPASYGPSAEHASARWLVAVLASVVAALVAAAVFVVWVDPFQQYHLASRFAPRFYFLHHRYINPGLARNQSYDTVVSGSSIMENTRNDAVAKACGGSAVNLSMPAMSASEQRLMLETAFAYRRVKRVIAVLDFNEFAGGVDERQDVAGPLPRYLYDRDPFNDLPYLLSWDVLLKSWRIVVGDTSERFTSDPNAAWYWGNVVRFGRTQVLRGLDLGHLNARYKQPPRTLQGMRASFDHNLLPLLRDHPEAEFDLVWPPYSILVWVDFAQRDQLDVTFAFKRYVAEVAATLPNVRITDLQAERAITHDLDRYDDIYHFDPAVNEWIVDAACRRRDRVDAGNVAAFERELRDQIAAVRTPLGLQAVVDGRTVP
ncbi:MAG TPA: hypothetical protein VL742_10240 [Casimicrobiaceae bacterium]|nr:hypothetical protein [Casimicrobiaceae bacterium]